ncbi:hypothetical protein Tco_1397651, partial [Tanacetum coccineum]
MRMIGNTLFTGVTTTPATRSYNDKQPKLDDHANLASICTCSTTDNINNYSWQQKYITSINQAALIIHESSLAVLDNDHVNLKKHQTTDTNKCTTVEVAEEEETKE